MALISELDDRSLVERHHAGDEDAFRRIVERHHRALYTHALRRLSNPSQAEDAVQDTFLRAFRSLDRFNGEYHLDAWLHRILTNVCMDMGRRQGRDLRLVSRVSGEIEPTAPAADDDLESVPPAEVDAALDLLPDPYREAVVLRFIEELSYSDVADRAGISEQNARARVSRGRSMLRSMLNGVSAAFIFVIPRLRRNQLEPTDGSALTGAHHAASTVDAAASVTTVVAQAAPAAAQASVAATQAAPALTQASGILAQVGPAIAQVAPAVTSTGPAIKAAVAMGLAASVAIPAGVAVERRLDARSEPAVAAPFADAEAEGEVPAQATSSVPESHASDIAVAGDDVAADGTADTTTDGAAAATDGTTESGATVDGAADGSTDGTADGGTAGPTPGAPPVSEDDPTATPAAPPGDFSAESVSVTEAGPRLEVAGAFVLTVGDEAFDGNLSGKLLLGDADPKNASAPRDLSGVVTYTFADGTTAGLEIRGTATQTAEGRFALAGSFRLTGDTHGLAEGGTFSGTFVSDPDAGSLSFSLSGDQPPAASAQAEPSTTTTEPAGTSTDPVAADPAA